MFEELCLYLELLFFLAGTLLYGFLARTLWRRPEVLAGNWPVRALLASLLVWYGGTLFDHLVFLLLGAPRSWIPLGVAVDVLRGLAWLLSFSLLAHTLERLVATAIAPSRPGWLRLAPWLAYATFPLFVLPALRFAGGASGGRDGLLAVATREVFPRVVLHGAWTLALAAGLLAVLRRHLEEPRFRRFLGWLAMVLAALFALLVVSSLFDPWSPEAASGERLLRTFLLGGLLLPGGLFAFHVQRYNLLRLSMSHRTLRHFAAVVVLVVLVMAAGPAAGVEDLAVFRRVVAWGLLLALFGGTVYGSLVDLALRRWPMLRRWYGRNLEPRELDALMDSLQNPQLEESEIRHRTAEAVGRWLGCRAEFLPEPATAPATGELWQALGGAERPFLFRLDPPSPEVADTLARGDLHAAFALRVEGELEGVLGLSRSATGGGYADGELEAVRLVMRQLAGTLALRRLLATRLAEERRAEEHERLGLLGLVSASLAHEIKNPLASMKSLAQTLREDLAETDPGGDGVADLDLIVEQIDRLDRTTREILGVARPRPGEAVDLGALVESAVYILGAEARKRGVELESGGIAEVGAVAGSPAAWQTVVFNLVLNAVEHTPAGETARVELRRGAGEEGFELTTENPGEPLGPELRQRIFEPFVGDEQGTGLGLALVHRRLQELGAGIELDHPPGRVRFRVRGASHEP